MQRGRIVAACATAAGLARDDVLLVPKVRPRNSRGPHVLQALTMLRFAGLSSLMDGSRTLSSMVLRFLAKED
jgi:hypothetical protein